MIKISYKNVSEYYFSYIYSGDYYSYYGVITNEKLKNIGWEDFTVRIFKHYRGEFLFSKIIDLPKQNNNSEILSAYMHENHDIINHYEWMIMNPPHVSNVLWPTDILFLKNSFQHYNNLKISNYYNPYIERNNDNSLALLFKYGDFKVSDYVSANILFDIIKMYREDYGFSYRNSFLCEFCREILKIFSSLNENGYMYYDIDESRIFFKKSIYQKVSEGSNVDISLKNSVLLDFSNQIYSKSDKYKIFNSTLVVENPSDYSLSYADPAFFKGIIDTPDYASQNYSLSAFLFRVLFGVSPYDGDLNSFRDDDGDMAHYNKCCHCLENPVFIFDNDDKSNNLGVMKFYDYYKQLWAECPEEIKTMFYNTLIKDHALRNNRYIPPTPQEWISVFLKYGWIK